MFRRQDFRNPQNSSLIADLSALGDHEIKEKLEFLIEACDRSKRGQGGRAPHRKATGKESGAVKPSPSTTRKGKADSPASSRASWLSDYVEDYGGSDSKGVADRGR